MKDGAGVCPKILLEHFIKISDKNIEVQLHSSFYGLYLKLRKNSKPIYTGWCCTTTHSGESEKKDTQKHIKSLKSQFINKWNNIVI